jgi:hypothetical protein
MQKVQDSSNVSSKPTEMIKAKRRRIKTVEAKIAALEAKHPRP